MRAVIKSVAAVSAGATIAATVTALAYMQVLPGYFFYSIIAPVLWSFWVCAWSLDMIFTVENWKYVVMGYETNQLVNAIAKYVTHGKAFPTIMLHLACIILVIYLMTIAVSTVVHPADKTLFNTTMMCSLLLVAGIGHVDAFLKSREFLKRLQLN